MKLVVVKRAAKDLETVPARVADDVMAAMERIAAAPFAGHASVKRLTGQKSMFRYRSGDWRALYEVDDARQTVFLVRVLHRKEAYR